VILRIVHRTLFAYSEEIADTSMELRVKPVDDASQRVRSYELLVDPRGPVREYHDVFGNWVQTWNHRPPHNHISVEARSTVETRPAWPTPVELSPSDRWRLLQHDGPVMDVWPVRELSAIAQPGDEAALAELTRAINARFVYQSNVTNVTSTVADLAELGKGVCQDFAHVWIAACRAAGIPARYVSGYLYTGDSHQPQASHAWGEAWLPQAGWLAFDPTNPKGGVGEGYVRVAVGRDYRDVPPTRGIFRGAASEKLSVDVRVEQVGTTAAVSS
jgi:transglutaminase-like putative cysteine protease